MSNVNIIEKTYQIEYIWFGSNGEFRSKVRIIRSQPNQINRHLSTRWSYDGSSTGQATTEASEITLVPVAHYEDRSKKRYFYLLCDSVRETVDENGQITQATNLSERSRLADLLNNTEVSTLDIWFGFEQEFFIRDQYSLIATEQGPFYCGVEVPRDSNPVSRSNRVLEQVRPLTEAIVARCMDIGVNLTGWNLEVAPGQTEIQVFGAGIKACDDLMMMRYMAHRVLAEHTMVPDFSPKPLGPDWNGSGLHTNVSTAQTRAEGGMDAIRTYMQRMEERHAEHISVYGEGNEQRLTGQHETSSMERFTWGVGNRASSVRIPTETARNGRGYFEDRRPAANANPYAIARVMMETLGNIRNQSTTGPSNERTAESTPESFNNGIGIGRLIGVNTIGQRLQRNE